MAQNDEQFRAEMYRRFRRALVGYIVLAVAAFGGLVVSYEQQRTLKHNQQQIGELAVCDAPRAIRQELNVNVNECAALLRSYRNYAP